MSDSFADLATEALDCVACECPPAYDGMCAALGDRTVAVTVDGETFTLDLRGPGAAIAPSALESPVTFRATASALHDVLRGELDLLDAILTGDIFLRAAVVDLVRLADTLLFFAKGAVRSNSLAPLLTRLERVAAKTRRHA